MANGIRGLLGDPRFNLGLGLLAAGGPSREPSSLGQNMAQATQFAAERDRQSMENRAARQELQARQRRQDAQQELRGLLGSQEMIRGPGQEVTGIGGENIGSIPGRVANVPTISTPQGQQRAMGLLAEASPEQFSSQLSSGLLGQMFGGGEQGRAEPSDVRIARVLADPNESQEVKDEIRAQLEARGMDEQLATRIRAMEAQQLQNKLEQAETERERNETRARFSVLNADEALREAARINMRLQNTLGETGIGLNEIRNQISGPVTALKLNRLFGISDDQARQVAADMQAFDQITTREGLRSLFEGQLGQGNVTNSRLETYFDTKPGTDKLTETNARAIARMMEDNLQSSSILGIELPDRSVTERLIEQQNAMAEGETLQPGSNNNGTTDSGSVIDFNDLPE